MKKMKQAQKYGAGLAALAATNYAMAAVDVTAITTELSGNETAMVSVGTGMLGLVVIVVLFTMVRRVLK